MPKIPNPPERGNVNYRPTLPELSRLRSVADRYARGKITRAIEYAVSLFDRPCSSPHAESVLGIDSPDHRIERIAQNLDAWAHIVVRASEDNSRTFSREDWGMMAECCNGLLLDGVLSPQVVIAAEVYDGHKLNGYGLQWYGEEGEAGKSGEPVTKRVASLVKRLRGLDDTHGWAVAIALRYFWDHPEVGMEVEWWKPENRTAREEH